MRRHVTVSAAAILSACAGALGVDVTVTRVDNTHIKVKICPSNTEVVKDFHFDRGALPNGAAGVTVVDDQGLGWSVNVKAGKVNVFGSTSVPATPTCTEFTITLPAGQKFATDAKVSITLTNDGNDDAQTGVVTTITGKVPKIVLASTYKDSFDTYAAGSLLAGQGSWEVWYAGGASGVVTSERSVSPPNSVFLGPGADTVQTLPAIGGKWVFRAMTFVPESAAPGLEGGYLIMMNQYGSPTLDNWSLQIAHNNTQLSTNPLPLIVESQFDNAFTDVIRGQWVEFRSEIDLDADLVQNYYNNVPLGVPHSWSNNGFGAPGLKEIANIDLWSPAGGMYVDDVIVAAVAPPCYPDCNGDGQLNLADFGCFQTKFALGDPYADCNGDGVRNLSDFGCFQTKFALGCP